MIFLFLPRTQDLGPDGHPEHHPPAQGGGGGQPGQHHGQPHLRGRPAHERSLHHAQAGGDEQRQAEESELKVSEWIVSEYGGLIEICQEKLKISRINIY